MGLEGHSIVAKRTLDDGSVYLTQYQDASGGGGSKCDLLQDIYDPTDATLGALPAIAAGSEMDLETMTNAAVLIDAGMISGLFNCGNPGSGRIYGYAPYMDLYDQTFLQSDSSCFNNLFDKAAGAGVNVLLAGLNDYELCICPRNFMSGDHLVL